MSQEVRNKVYAIAAALVLILGTLGVVDKATGDEALTLTNGALDVLSEVLALVGLITAFIKSLPSRTTTIDQPKAQVTEVALTDGTVVAGPANPLPDNTVLN